MIFSPAIVCCLGPTYYQVSRADHQRSGQARRFKDNRVILSSRLSVLVTNAPSVWLQYVSCFAGDLVPSPPGDRVDGHRELVGGGLPLQADGLPQVSRVILLSCHPDLGLLQNIRLLRFGIHPHRHLLGQVREDVCKDAIMLS